MRKVMNVLLVAAVLISTFSCLSDTPDAEKINGGEADVVLRIRASESFSGNTTRAFTHNEENAILDIYVLVFDRNNQLKDIKKADILSNETPGSSQSFSGKGTFTVSLNASTGDTDTYRLVVLANAEDILNNTIGTNHLQIGERGYNDVVKDIFGGIEGKMFQTQKAIPMWGEATDIVISESTKSLSIELTRAIARIDVGVGMPTKDGNNNWSWSGKDGTGKDIPFELTKVYVMRPNNQYLVIPASTNALSIPQSVQKFTTSVSRALFGYEAAGFSSRDIYVPEADIEMGSGKPGDANHRNRMAVVVGGKYNGSPTETFYRLDFAIGGNLINVKRNTLYQFNISGVSGAGYPDPETAYNNWSMNMEVEIYDWDETDMGEIFIDGSLHVRLQNSRNENRNDRTAVLYRHENSTDIIVFRTNIAEPLNNFVMQLSNGGKFPDENDTRVIENERFRVEMKEENGVNYFEFTALQPYGTSQNPSVLTVTIADRIKFDIRIMQRNDSPDDWIDGGGQGVDLE